MESLDSQLASSQNQESSKPRPKIPQESPAKALRSVAGRRADRIPQESFYPVAKGALICLAGEATGGLRSIGVSAGDSFLLPSLSLRRRPCCAGPARACSGVGTEGGGRSGCASKLCSLLRSRHRALVVVAGPRPQSQSSGALLH
jgi:hypothetical protein|uniref:Uncharacterized protein n=1 Tax=Zea mays TaxID=4577 RepID=A0A804UJR5_MAIZE